MVGTAILLVFLFIAAVTDIRWRKVLNWTTYPGIVTAFALSGLATWFGVDNVDGTSRDVWLWGLVPMIDSFIGFCACGAAVLACYVFFPGGIGGGDVKLIAMMGAFMGLYQGLEAMLWTFILGGCQALIMLIWQQGAIELLRKGFALVRYLLRFGQVPVTDQEPKPPRITMFLSPSAFVATVIVRWHLAEWLRY